MKKAIIATVLSGVISSPVFAASSSDLADANLIFNMDNNQTAELSALSAEEMKSTEGAVIPLFLAPIAFGGAISSWTYHGLSYLRTGSLGSSSGAAIAAGTGALGGAYTGTMLGSAGIPTSIFARSAWTGGNQWANATIRTNGYFIGQSWLGVYNRR